MRSGSEFQIIGATKENEHLPLADFMLGYLLTSFDQFKLLQSKSAQPWAKVLSVSVRHFVGTGNNNNNNNNNDNGTFSSVSLHKRSISDVIVST